MWNTTPEYKKASSGEWQTPTYEVNFFNDVFDLGSSALGGNFTQKFYNAKNQSLSAGLGTTTLAGVIFDGTKILLGTGGTIGSWTSQILTPYYNAKVDKLQTYDFVYYEESPQAIQFLEGFDSYESMRNNGAILGFQYGTIQKGGQRNFRGNYLEVYANGSSNLNVFYPNSNVKEDIFNTGELHAKGFFAGGSLGTLGICSINSDTGANIGLKLTSNGTHRLLYAGYTLGANGTNLLIGTISAGTAGAVAMTWGTVVANKRVIAGWAGSFYAVGTTNPLTGIGNFNDIRLLSCDKGCTGTYAISKIFINNSFESAGANYKIPYYDSVGNITYYIQTSTDGTTFGNWQNITGTRINSSDNRSINSYVTSGAGSSPEGNYFRVMAVMSSIGTGMPMPLYGVKAYTSYPIKENQIISIGDITNSLENDFVMGQIDNSSVSISLTNAGTKLISDSYYPDWRDNAIFYNRPAYLNSLVKIKAGFAGTFGTQLIPVFSGYIQNTDVSENEMEVSCSITSNWAFYGDKKLTGTYGTMLGDEAIQTACNSIGILRENTYIDRTKKLYVNTPVVSSKGNSQTESRGGFGDVYNFRTLDFGDKGIIRSIGQSVHPTKGIFNTVLYNISYNPNTDLGQNTDKDNSAFITDMKFNKLTEAGFEGQGGANPVMNSVANIVALQDCTTPTDTLRTFIYAKPQQSVGTSQFIIADWKKDYTNFKKSNSALIGVYDIPAFDTNGVAGYGSTINNVMFYDSIQGTGYFFRTEAGTTKKYNFNLYQTNSAFNVLSGSWTGANGTFTLTGTTDIQAGAGVNFHITSAFMLPEPVSIYQGTNKYYYACYGREGTLNYMYRFGTGTGQNWGFVDKISTGNAYNVYIKQYAYGTDYSGTRGGYIGTTEKPQGTEWVYIAGAVLDGTTGNSLNNGWAEYNNNILHVGGHRLANINTDVGWEQSRELFNNGLFGFTFQHNTVSTVGSVLLNGSVMNAGSYTVLSDKTGFIFKDLYSLADTFSSSYSVFGQSVTLTIGSYTFKDLVQKTSIPAMAYAYFDGYGNFIFQDRSVVGEKFFLSNANTPRSYGTVLNEQYMGGQTQKDINKVKNVVTVKGTGGVTGTVIKDNASITIFGTRELSEYKNEFINTNADCGTMALILLENLKYAKSDVSLKIPFHPELENTDYFDYTDTFNLINLSNVQVKSITHSLTDWSTQIKGIEKPIIKTGTGIL
jgi:hypothetical protein